MRTTTLVPPLFHTSTAGAAFTTCVSHGTQPSFTTCPLVHNHLHNFSGHSHASRIAIVCVLQELPGASELSGHFTLQRSQFVVQCVDCVGIGALVDSLS
jgi:hypothetical protein